MQALPARRRRALVDDVAVQRVDEREATADAAVARGRDAGTADQAALRREVLEALFHVLRGEPGRGSGERRGELDTGDGRGLDHARLGGIEQLDLALDHAAQLLGHLARDVLGQGREPPRAVRLDQQVALEQVLDDAGDEQRAAAGPLVQDRREAARRRAAETQLDVALDLVLAEVGERHLGAQPPRVQAVLQVADRVLGDHRVDRPVAAQHEEARGLAALREKADQVERRGIAPVEVLEHEDQRLLRAERLGELGDLAQHALARGALELALQRCAAVLADEPGHLHEPARRHAAQRLDEGRPAGAARERAERLEHRQVRLAAAEVVEALAARDAHRRLDPREPRVDQRRLADAGLAGHEHHLALRRRAPGPAVLVERRERVVAADERQPADGRRPAACSAPARAAGAEASAPAPSASASTATAKR